MIVLRVACCVTCYNCHWSFYLDRIGVELLSFAIRTWALRFTQHASRTTFDLPRHRHEQRHLFRRQTGFVRHLS